ncbi:MAG: glycosyltransferase family 39 protein, partial [Candidatus Moraniibacteriota bacterium]
MAIKRHIVCIAAGLMLLAMFLLALLSIRDDTFTFDETAHVSAGYSYLTQRDYRMNPEHPPLIKDLSAVPLLFLNLNFPENNPTWTNASPAVWWHQFDFGTQFLYNSGNDPDKIMFWSRIPMMLMMILLGWLIFKWARELWGDKASLTALFLYAFSPTFLAHGRLVTTDVGAAFGVVLSAYFWLKFLKNPTKKYLVFAGLAFGTAMLIKFSLILLLPFLAIITFVYAWLNGGNKKIKFIFKYVLLSLLAGLIGFLFVIWPVYEYHVSNYPQERQIKDTKTLLATTNVPDIAIKLNLLLDGNNVTRPIGQYLLGILTAGNRTTTGNTTYFMGQISADSWRSYFPIVYFIKNPLPFHILTLIALIYALWLIKKPWQNTISRKITWIRNHFAEFSMFTWLAIYWATSLVSNLNIGVRHLMPVFPFTILLVAAGIASLIKGPRLKIKYGVLGILAVWQIVSVVSVFPHFIAYFNEIAGGPESGYKYAVDSNLDWGQDLKRLKLWMDANNVDMIYIDYFGGGNLNYYLGTQRYARWWGTRNTNELPKGSYLAVSATQLQGGRATPVKNFDQASD